PTFANTVNTSRPTSPPSPPPTVRRAGRSTHPTNCATAANTNTSPNPGNPSGTTTPDPAPHPGTHHQHQSTTHHPSEDAWPEACSYTRGVEAESPESLPEPMARVLGDYERHLAVERDLSEHTVRAYLGDLGSMLEHAHRLGHEDVTTIDLRSLRSWL